LRGTSTGGKLSAVTLQGNLDLTGFGNTNATVVGPLTLSGGTVSLGGGGGTYGVLRFDDPTASLTGPAPVAFSGQPRNVFSTLQENASGGTLTIGPGVAVHGGAGSIGYNPGLGGFSNVSVVNQGTIAADAAGTLSVNGSSVTNNGVFLASSGGTLAVPPG